MSVYANRSKELLPVVLASLLIPLLSGCNWFNTAKQVGPIKLRVTCFVKNRMIATKDGGELIDGTRVFTFENVDTSSPIALTFPPDEIYEITSNYTIRVAREEWPDFARASLSFTLQPNERRLFQAPFGATPIKKGDAPATVRFVFGAGSRRMDHSLTYSGNLTGESSWGTEKQKVTLKAPMKAG
jgi:hypothetical protein